MPTRLALAGLSSFQHGRVVTHTNWSSFERWFVRFSCNLDKYCVKMSPDCYIFDEFFYFDVTMFFDKKNKIASVTFSGTLSPKNRSKLITELVGEISFYPSYDYLVDLRDTVADETDELSMVKAVNMAYQLSKLLAFHATKLAFVIPHDKQHIKNGKNVVTAL